MKHIFLEFNKIEQFHPKVASNREYAHVLIPSKIFVLINL